MMMMMMMMTMMMMIKDDVIFSSYITYFMTFSLGLENTILQLLH